MASKALGTTKAEHLAWNKPVMDAFLKQMSEVGYIDTPSISLLISSILSCTCRGHAEASLLVFDALLILKQIEESEGE